MSGKKFSLETEKVNEFWPNIPTGNITELNELIYAGAKLVCNEVSVPRRNQNRNTKPGWEIRLEEQVKKM